MSTSYNSGVFLGIKLIDIGYNVEKVINSFEVHDKKGNPTGKFENEDSWKHTFNGKEKLEDKLYIEDIENISNVKKPLEVFNQNDDYSEFDMDNVVIGIDIVKNNYDEYYCLKEISDISSQIDLVKSIIRKQFNIEVEPKLYYYFSVS